MTIVNAAGEMIGPGGQVLGPRELLQGARVALQVASAQAQLQAEVIRALEQALLGLLHHGTVAALPEDTEQVKFAQQVLARLGEIRQRAREAEQRRIAAVQASKPVEVPR